MRVAKTDPFKIARTAGRRWFCVFLVVGLAGCAGAQSGAGSRQSETDREEAQETGQRTAPRIDAATVEVSRSSWRRLEDLGVPAAVPPAPGRYVGVAYAGPDADWGIGLLSPDPFGPSTAGSAGYVLAVEGRGLVRLHRESSPGAFGAVSRPANPWGLRAKAHLVEVTMAESGGHTVVVGAAVLDGAPPHGLVAEEVLLGLGARFRDHLSRQAGELSARLDEERQRRGAGWQFGERERHTGAVPTWHARDGLLEVWMIHSERQLASPPARDCPSARPDRPSSSCLGSLTPGPNYVAVTLAVRYVVGAGPALVREVRYAPVSSVSGPAMTP